MKEKIGVIGLFSSENCNGQTVKTQNLVSLLESRGNYTVVKVDTYLFRINRKIKLLFKTLHCLLRCKNVFLMVSVNGMNFYLPFLYYLNKFMRRRIFHYIIGSELLDMVEKNEKLVKYLNAFEANWFEFESGTEFLQRKNVTNVSTLSNFKMLTPVESTKPYTDKPFRFCTFSRVMEEKGITAAINAVREINEESLSNMVQLDIYGSVEDEYESVFLKLLKENEPFVRYMGVVESNSSVDILEKYYALLFPTHWVGEGVAGTIIDAFASGIPVIASDWHANSELIQNGRQGIIYPNAEIQGLKEAIIWAIQNPNRMNEMRVYSRSEYEKYSPDVILNEIRSRI